MKKNLAIVGFGGMGGWHADNALKSDVVELVGVYDIKPERLAVARERGIHAYSSLEEVLCDPKIDLITIATPNDVHREIAIKALEAGKNVISEKPVTLCSSDLEEMIAASERTGKLFTVHQNRRWDGELLVMKKVLESGDLGPVFNIESRVHGSRGIPGDWRGMKRHGGGMMLDWGVHLIDQAMQMLKGKKPSRIYARYDHVTNAEVDDGFKLDMMFDDGLVFRVEVGTSNFINMPRFYMQGENGTAIIPDWCQSAKVVCCKNWNEKDVVPVVTAAGITKTMAPRDESSIVSYEVPQPESDVHDFYRNFCAAIDGREEQIVKHDEMRLVMKIMEAANESDRLGTVIDFE